MDKIDPNNPQKQYKGVWLPKEILDNPSLSPAEKILLAQISTLEDEALGGCYASNEYLASTIMTTPKNVSDIISRLIKAGILERVSFDGRKRIIKVGDISKLRPTIQRSKTVKADRSLHPEIQDPGSCNSGVSEQGSQLGSDNIVYRKGLLEENVGGGEPESEETDKERMKPIVVYQRVKSIFRQRKDVDKKTCLEGVKKLQERLDDESIFELATYCASDKFKPIIREDGSSWKPNFFWFTNPDKTESVVNTFKGTPSLYQEKRRLKY